MARGGPKDKEAYNVYMREYMRERYRKNTEWMRQYKLDQGCADCGYNAHHAGLEFDHRDGVDNQNNRVARLMGKSINRIKEEIAKCDVVCGTCHRIRTFERLQKKLQNDMVL